MIMKDYAEELVILRHRMKQIEDKFRQGKYRDAKEDCEEALIAARNLYLFASYGPNDD